MDMSFEETKKIIFDFFDPLNSVKYEMYDGLNTQGVKEFFHSEQQSLEKQMKEDIVIKRENINEEWFQNVMVSFLRRTNEVIYNVQHPEEFRVFQRQVTIFLKNWINILHYELHNLITMINHELNKLQKQVELWYSIYDLIQISNQQSNNLKKWNSFRPAGFNIAQHMLDDIRD